MQTEDYKNEVSLSVFCHKCGLSCRRIKDEGIEMQDVAACLKELYEAYGVNTDNYIWSNIKLVNHHEYRIIGIGLSDWSWRIYKTNHKYYLIYYPECRDIYPYNAKIKPGRLAFDVPYATKPDESRDIYLEEK